MRKVVVTGSSGFIGRNLVVTLQTRPDVEVLPFDVEDGWEVLEGHLAQADFVFHLAGVNRPPQVEAFEAGNADLTRRLLDGLRAQGRAVPVLLSSSIQAALDNPYGLSKAHAEEAVRAYGRETQAPVHLYRLPNVFGKWSRPNYNSVVATFCHNAAHGLPLEVHDPARTLDLVHVDDVVAAFLDALDGKGTLEVDGFLAIPRVFRTTLGELAARIGAFPGQRETCALPEVGDELTRRLYSMYLSYLPTTDFGYPLVMRHDPRGWLAEVLRSPSMGQIFVSTTRPGITRGNHWHHTKTEKFLVVQGEAVVRFRPVQGGDVLEYPVSGEALRVVDIPPGYTHSITNVGTTDLVTLFWASEPFSPECPDTHAMTVQA